MYVRTSAYCLLDIDKARLRRVDAELGEIAQQLEQLRRKRSQLIEEKQRLEQNISTAERDAARVDAATHWHTTGQRVCLHDCV